jgi:hypothetical protein
MYHFYGSVKMNEFCGICVQGEGRVVQEWHDGLIEDAQIEILNMVLHLAILPMGLWERPDFDPLVGEGGISELRPKDIRSNTGNSVYRIYGWKKYPTKNSYTFLHGTDKDEKNDVEGKQSAKQRAHELFVAGRARTHKFNFYRRTAKSS